MNVSLTKRRALCFPFESIIIAQIHFFLVRVIFEDLTTKEEETSVEQQEKP